MADSDQERAPRALADAIRDCVKMFGPACSARHLGVVALDLAKANVPTQVPRHDDRPPTQSVRNPQESIRYLTPRRRPRSGHKSWPWRRRPA